LRKIINLDDTIAGISAPTGGSISIVRMSGEEALPILRRVFVCKVQDYESHRIYYGWVKDGDVKIDEVLVSVMLAPRTFTRQDVVEINCHGGALVTSKVLALLVKHGARLADPGEFTKRAFLAGRIDLSRAEAVMDIITAQSDSAHQAALGQLEGRLSGLLDKCSNNLLNLLARIEMAIDYPEHEEADLLENEVKEGVQAVLSQVQGLLDTAATGRIIREGIKTAILGAPNVGKSSLLNALVGTDRAIVTPVAGTTRDVLRESIRIGELFLNIADTAGVRPTDDIVESEGVARSIKEAKDADLVLLVLDGSEPNTQINFNGQDEWKNVIIVVNKSDLPQKLSLDTPHIAISAKNHEGIEKLTAAIKNMFITNEMQYSKEIVTNTRHIALLNHAKENLAAAIDAVASGMPVDMTAIDIGGAYTALGEITGAVVDEELIERIFSQFCLGK